MGYLNKKYPTKLELEIINKDLSNVSNLKDTEKIILDRNINTMVLAKVIYMV